MSDGIVINSRGDTFYPGENGAAGTTVTADEVSRLGGSSNGVLTNRDIITLSALVARQHLAGQLGMQYDGERDVYQALGYKLNLTIEDYRGKYDRQDIAARIIEMPPADSWKKPPQIFDGEIGSMTTEGLTDFLSAWTRLARRLRVWHWLERADRLAGIGRYGILLIGTATPGQLSDPVANGLKEADIIYLKAFTEKNASVRELVKDPMNERFGQPLSYTVNFGEGLPSAEVHWSRVIHIAEGLEEDQVYGRPRLQRVYDRLDDLLKIVGGGSEATWRLVYQGVHANANPEMDLDKDTKEKMKEQVDEFVHGFRRFLVTKGFNVTSFGGATVDPTGLYNIATSLISAATGIPRRILLGSERGELASSQDESNWAGVVAGRQRKYVEPTILVPFIDRLLQWGALPQPQSGEYHIGSLRPDGTRGWPSIYEMNEQEQATIDQTRAQTRQVEWDSAQIPVITRWREVGYTEAADLNKLKADYEESQALGMTDFVPDIEQ